MQEAQRNRTAGQVLIERESGRGMTNSGPSKAANQAYVSTGGNLATERPITARLSTSGNLARLGHRPPRDEPPAYPSSRWTEMTSFRFSMRLITRASCETDET